MNTKNTHTRHQNQEHPRHQELNAVAGFHVTESKGYLLRTYRKVTRYWHSLDKEAFLADLTIGEMAGGYSRDTVQEGKKDFKKAGWLTWGKKDHAQTPNYYFLADNQRWNKFWFLFLLVFGKSDFLAVEKPLQFSDPTLLDIKVKKIVYLNSQSQSLSRAHARDGDASHEALTMESGEVFVTPLIREATKTLNLTRWGQIQLAAFPNEVIEHALKQLSFAKPQNPFHWFFKVCLEYCSANKIVPDWDYLKALATKYGMPSKPDFVLATCRSDTAKASPAKNLNEQAKQKVSVPVKELFPNFEMPKQQTIEQSIRNKMETVEMLRALPSESLNFAQKIVLEAFLEELKDISKLMNN